MMATNRTDQGTGMEAGEQKRLTVRLDQGLYLQMRMLAQVTDSTLNDVVTDALAEYVERRADDPELRAEVDRFVKMAKATFGGKRKGSG